jgi:DNA-binding XRE family transcriptional regulator
MDARMDEKKLSTKVPLPVRRALYKLGRDIRDARLRRRIATAIMAQRASISRTTLNKVEKGDPGVSLGNYAAVLFVLGLSDRLSTLADVRSDTVGLELDEGNLPRRIRRRTRGTRSTSDTGQPK